MTGLDIIVLLIVGVAAIVGFMRGFVQEMLSLAGWILAIFAIRYLHTDLTVWLSGYIGISTGTALLAFALLLVVPYAAMRLIAGRVGRASRNSIIGPFDRVLGFGFGAIKGIIMVVVAFSVLVLVYDTAWGPKGRPDWIKNARTYQFINAASDEMVQLIEARRERLREEDDRVPSEG